MPNHIARRATITLSFMLLASPAAFAQARAAHPNFSGVWVMDAARSDSSSFTPMAASYTVVHHGDSLSWDRVSVSRTNDTTRSRMVWGTDGKPWKNTLPLVGMETQATSLLTWSHDTLVVHTSSQPQGADLQQIDSWSLSADGKTLSMKRQAMLNGQSIGSPTLVFVKKS